MVKLEEVEDEAFTQEQLGEEEDWNTDDDSDVSSVFSDDADDETLFDRVAALKDVIPPAQRRQIASTASAASSWSWWSVSSVASLSWTIGVSILLLGIPFAVAQTEDAQQALEEKQANLQQSQNEFISPGTNQA